MSTEMPMTPDGHYPRRSPLLEELQKLEALEPMKYEVMPADIGSFEIPNEIVNHLLEPLFRKKITQQHTFVDL